MWWPLRLDRFGFCLILFGWAAWTKWFISNGFLNHFRKAFLINLIKLVNCPRINKFKRRSNVLINMISKLSKQCREKGNAQKRIEDELRESEMLDLPGKWSAGIRPSDWLILRIWQNSSRWTQNRRSRTINTWKFHW